MSELSWSQDGVCNAVGTTVNVASIFFRKKTFKDGSHEEGKLPKRKKKKTFKLNKCETK